MKKLTTEQIHGKDYATVATRVTYFRHSGLYDGFCIVTKEKPTIEGEVKVLAKVYDDKDRLVATGHASEKINSTNINKTSALENCETSAVGRALAFLGISSDGSIASSDELKQAQNAQREILERDYYLLLEQLEAKTGKESKDYNPKNWKEGKSVNNFTDLSAAYKALTNKLKNIDSTANAVDKLVKPRP